jgi:hypothetical protein
VLVSYCSTVLIGKPRELGFSGMVWQVLDWNEPAINFYKKYEANIEAGWLNASLIKFIENSANMQKNALL